MPRAGADPDHVTPVLDRLQSLLDKSLSLHDVDLAGEPSFVMLETIREYALEALQASGENGAVQEHHAAYFLGLAEQAERVLATSGSALLVWLERLDADYDNLRAALEWCRAQ